jgi:hypothetical protein
MAPQADLVDGEPKLTRETAEGLAANSVAWNIEVSGFGVCRRRHAVHVLKCQLRDSKQSTAAPVR